MRLYAILAALLVMAGLTAWAFAERGLRSDALRERDQWQAKAGWLDGQLIAERATSTKYRTLADSAAKEAASARARASLAEDAARALIADIQAEETQPVPAPQPGASAPACSYQLPSDWRRRLQNDIPIRRPEANPAAAGQRGDNVVP